MNILKHRKWLPFLVVVFAVGWVLAHSGDPFHMGQIRQAWGQSAGPLEGVGGGTGATAAIGGTRQQCSGSGTLASGIYSIQAPCLTNYTLCGAVPNGAVTPTAGVQNLNCNVTAIATVTIVGTATATFTAPGVAILAAPSSSSVVNWWGIK